VRVTDSAAQTAEDSVSFELTSGWSTVVIDDAVTMEYSEYPIAGEPALAMVGPAGQQRPAVAYQHFDAGILRYAIADDDGGTVWGDPRDLTGEGTGYWPAMMDVQGMPAIAFNRPSEFNNGNFLYYTRATALDGSAWGEVKQLSEVDGGEIVLTQAEGKPAIYSITIKYDWAPFTYVLGYRAVDELGAEWNPPDVPDYVAEEAYVNGLSAMTISGKPALCYGFHDFVGDPPDYVRFLKADDVTETPWPAPRTFGANWVLDSACMFVDGNPAAAYSDYFETTGVYYVRADDALGESWNNEPLRVDERAGVGRSCSMAVHGGVPWLSYYDAGAGDLLVCTASDAQGTSWGDPLVLASSGDVGKLSELLATPQGLLLVYSDLTEARLMAAAYE
jgi:hypothetical protein